MRMVRHWHRFHRGIVKPPSMEIFKTQLDMVLDNQVLLNLPEQGLGPGDHESSPLLQPFWGSVLMVQQ